MNKNATYCYSNTPQAKYDRNNTTFIGLRLQVDSDSDILAAIHDKPKQTEIKKLVRAGLLRAKKTT